MLRAAAAWFHRVAIDRIERVMTDDAQTCRRCHAWRRALTDLGARPRFNGALADKGAYVRPFTSSAERAAALPGWLCTYSHDRNHTALDGQPPISRLTVNNPTGHYN